MVEMHQIHQELNVRSLAYSEKTRAFTKRGWETVTEAEVADLKEDAEDIYLSLVQINVKITTISTMFETGPGAEKFREIKKRAVESLKEALKMKENMKG